MQIRVGLSRWEHDCCGIAYEINDAVTWELFLPYRGTPPNDADFIEIHHEEILNGTMVSGSIVAIGLMHDGRENAPLLRLPSGSALCGNHDNDVSRLVNLVDGSVIDNDRDDFIVTLDVPDDAQLPTKRARYA